MLLLAIVTTDVGIGMPYAITTYAITRHDIADGNDMMNEAAQQSQRLVPLFGCQQTLPAKAAQELQLFG